MPQSDHLKLQRGAATDAKREQGGDGGEKGDHGRRATTTVPKICVIRGIYEF